MKSDTNIFSGLNDLKFDISNGKKNESEEQVP